MKYITRDREAGNVIDEFATREAAQEAIEQYELDDQRQGIYEPDFYEVAAIDEAGNEVEL
jgi:hypothetical protein